MATRTIALFLALALLAPALAGGPERVAVIGGFVTTLLLFAGTIPRAFGAWVAYASGDMATQ